MYIYRWKRGPLGFPQIKHIKMASQGYPRDDMDKVDEKAPELLTSVVDVENAQVTGEVNEFGNEIDHSYFNLSPLMRFHRSCLWQMILFGA